ncbi:MAG: glutamyl-tRNA reductase [Synergistaceae bacterium]
MQIKIAGVDYINSPLSIREKFAFTSTSATEFLTKIKHSTEECILIFTCNRTELIVISETDPIELLKKERGNAKFFTYEGEEAIEHIYNVAAGICSQVPLEDQILGQVKDALNLSQALKCCGPTLSKLFQSAISAGKEIRSEIKKGNNDTSISVAKIAFEKALKEQTTLTGKKCLIIGSGATGMLCAQLFLEAGSDVKMTIRRHRKDGATSSSMISTISYDEKNKYAIQADIIIGATSSPHFVLTEEDFKESDKKVTILDLAVPRDISTKIATYKNVTLYDMDSLGCQPIKSEFMEEIEKILHHHKTKFYEWEEIKECVPMIEEICDYAERELINTIGYKNEEEKEILEEAARNMMNKLLFSIKNNEEINTAKTCYQVMAKAAKI